MKAVVDRVSAEAGTSSQTRADSSDSWELVDEEKVEKKEASVQWEARSGPPGREIREYVVLSNPHCPESVGYWCGFFPKVWDQLQGSLRRGKLEGSGAKLRRVYSVKQAETLWMNHHGHQSTMPYAFVGVDPAHRSPPSSPRKFVRAED